MPSFVSGKGGKRRFRRLRRSIKRANRKRAGRTRRTVDVDRRMMMVNRVPRSLNMVVPPRYKGVFNCTVTTDFNPAGSPIPSTGFFDVLLNFLGQPGYANTGPFAPAFIPSSNHIGGANSVGAGSLSWSQYQANSPQTSGYVGLSRLLNYDNNTLYQTAVVRASSLSILCIPDGQGNTGNDSTMVMLASYPYQRLNPGIAGNQPNIPVLPNDIRQQARGKSVIASTSTNGRVLKNYVTVHDLFGVPRESVLDDNAFWCEYNNNTQSSSYNPPQHSAYWRVSWAVPANAVNPSFTLRLTLRAYVELFTLNQNVLPIL